MTVCKVIIVMKHCKRVLSVLVAFAAMSAVTAQTITFSQGEKGNSGGYQPTLINIDKADADGLYYSVEPDLNAFSKVKGILVREVDVNFKEQRSVSVPDSKGARIYHVQRDGQRMHVVIDLSDKKRFAMRHVSVDLSSFTIAADSMLVDVAVDKKVEQYDWTSVSPSGNHFALVYALLNTKSGEAQVQAMLYDRGMRCVWSHAMPVAAIADIFATDDGRIATAGTTNGEEKTDGTTVTFSLSDGLGTSQGRYPSVYRLGNVSVLNVFGDKVLTTALETDRGTGWAGSFTLGSAVTTGTVYTGCTSMLYDVAAGRMAGSDRHPFSKADARVFYNASLVSEIASPDINFLGVRAKAATPAGGAVLYGRSWLEKVTQQSNGMSSSVYYYKGMMLVNVDSTGRFVWMKPLMHDNGTNADFAINKETDMVAVGNDLYVVTNESPKDADTYDPDNAVRRTVLMVHGAIVAYRFAPDGSVAKQKLATDGINIIMTGLRPQAGGVFTFVSGQRKGLVSEIKIGK